MSSTWKWREFSDLFLCKSCTRAWCSTSGGLGSPCRRCQAAGSKGLLQGTAAPFRVAVLARKAKWYLSIKQNNNRGSLEGIEEAVFLWPVHWHVDNLQFIRKYTFGFIYSYLVTLCSGLGAELKQRVLLGYPGSWESLQRAVDSRPLVQVSLFSLTDLFLCGLENS